jgi:hypothetical protein
LKKAAATGAAAQIAVLISCYGGGINFTFKKAANQAGNFRTMGFQSIAEAIDYDPHEDMLKRIRLLGKELAKR